MQSKEKLPRLKDDRDPDEMKELVRKGYEEGEYFEHYREDSAIESLEKLMLEEFTQRLPSGGMILDLGSGPGVPFDRHLVDEGFSVIGIDISEKHTKMAMNLVPEARFIHGDFMQYSFDEKFDAIMSLYTIFHIPRNMHSTIFRKMHGWLKKDGIILVSMGTSDTPVDVQEFVGAEMAWSSFSIDENLRLITEAGFEIMLTVDDNRNPGEHHLWILATRKE